MLFLVFIFVWMTKCFSEQIVRLTPTFKFQGDGCDEGFVRYRGSCYHRSGIKLIYDSAVLYCAQRKATLPSVLNEYENYFLNRLAFGHPFWIALRKHNASWIWSNRSRSKFRKWMPGEPDGCCGVDVTCAEMNRFPYSGQWADAACLMTIEVLCKYNIKQRLRQKWSGGIEQQVGVSRFASHFGHVNTTQRDHLTTTAAPINSGTLRPETTENSMCCTGYLDSTVPFSKATAAITPAAKPFSLPITPANDVTTSDRSHFPLTNNKAQPSAANASAVKDTPSTTNLCNDGYKQMEEFCYKVNIMPRGRKGINMKSAWKKCQKDKASLASICSEAENNFIKGLISPVNGSAWFGLRIDLGQAYIHSRSYTDGTCCCYKNWRHGKPVNRNIHSSDCTIMNPDGKWEEFPCKNKRQIRAYVCKKTVKK